MYIRTVKEKIVFCSDQCCYSFHCSFGVKGDFLYECLIYVNIHDKWGLSGHIFPRERGGPVCVISSDPIFTLFTVERLKNTVFLAALFFFFKYSLYFILFYFFKFMAVLGLRFCARAFSICGKWGPLFIAVRGPLTIAASLVAEHRLQTRRLSNCGSRA